MTTDKITIFSNEEFGTIRTTIINDEPYFVGKDAAISLGYSNPRKAIIDHVDEEDKGVTKCDTLGGSQDFTVINESGLYSLILSSKLPKAKAFKRWVTHEVIPSIRKAGAYMTDSLLDRVKNDPEIIYSLAEELLTARNKVKGLETELSVAKPKAEFYDTFVNPNDCTGLRVTAKELNVPERKFINFLIDEKFLYRSPAQQLLPYKKPSNEGLFIVRDYYAPTYSRVQTLLTPKGKEVVRRRLIERGLICKYCKK